MYVLYLDDAGSVGNPQEKHFILAGICVFERQIHWLSEELDKVAAATGHPNPNELELHGNQILGRRGWWRKTRPEIRRRTIRHGLAAATALHSENQWRLFGVVVDKKARSPEDPVEYAFEQLANRFDRFIARNQRKTGFGDRGLIVLDKSARETRLQALATEFKVTGHRWGTLRNLADVPFFVDSSATRLIQYADLVSYALWQKFEKGDSEFFGVIADAFDAEGAIVHGLHHFKARDELCDCPACARSLFDR